MKLPAFFSHCRRSLRSITSTALTAALGLFPMATGARAQDAANSVAPEDRNGSVWAISGDKGNTVYLAGSVHLLREQDYPVSPVYDQAYANSHEIVMEIDMGEMLNPEGMMKMQALGMYGADDSLDQHLSPETLDRLRKYLDTHDMGKMLALALPRLKPGMIFMTISSLEAMRLNAKPELGLEMTYFGKAQEDAKPIRGLETIEFQMTRFDELSDTEIEELITKTLDEVHEMPDMIDKLIAAWHMGDEAKLDKLMNEQMEEEGKIRELLLTERNANWVPEIEKSLKGKKNVMFIVGAAHLIGKGSVIDLLRKKGFEVKKIAPKAVLKKAA